MADIHEFLQGTWVAEKLAKVSLLPIHVLKVLCKDRPPTTATGLEATLANHYLQDALGKQCISPSCIPLVATLVDVLRKNRSAKPAAGKESTDKLLHRLMLRVRTETVLRLARCSLQPLDNSVDGKQHQDGVNDEQNGNGDRTMKQWEREDRENYREALEMVFLKELCSRNAEMEERRRELHGLLETAVKGEQAWGLVERYPLEPLLEDLKQVVQLIESLDEMFLFKLLQDIKSGRGKESSEAGYPVDAMPTNFPTALPLQSPTSLASEVPHTTLLAPEPLTETRTANARTESPVEGQPGMPAGGGPGQAMEEVFVPTEEVAAPSVSGARQVARSPGMVETSQVIPLAGGRAVAREEARASIREREKEGGDQPTWTEVPEDGTQAGEPEQGLCSNAGQGREREGGEVEEGKRRVEGSGEEVAMEEGEDREDRVGSRAGTKRRKGGEEERRRGADRENGQELVLWTRDLCKLEDAEESSIGWQKRQGSRARDLRKEVESQEIAADAVGMETDEEETETDENESGSDEDYVPTDAEEDDKDAEEANNEDCCKECGGEGTAARKLLCCDTCPAAWHQDCVGLEEVPPGMWSCPHCAAMEGPKQDTEPLTQDPLLRECLNPGHATTLLGKTAVSARWGLAAHGCSVGDRHLSSTGGGENGCRGPVGLGEPNSMETQDWLESIGRESSVMEKRRAAEEEVLERPGNGGQGQSGSNGHMPGGSQRVETTGSGPRVSFNNKEDGLPGAASREVGLGTHGREKLVGPSGDARGLESVGDGARLAHGVAVEGKLYGRRTEVAKDVRRGQPQEGRGRGESSGREDVEEREPGGGGEQANGLHRAGRRETEEGTGRGRRGGGEVGEVGQRGTRVAREGRQEGQSQVPDIERREDGFWEMERRGREGVRNQIRDEEEEEEDETEDDEEREEGGREEEEGRGAEEEGDDAYALGADSWESEGGREVEDGEGGMDVEMDGHDEQCNLCDEPSGEEKGDLLCCDGCKAAQHLACAGVEAVPDGEWLCKLCKRQRLVEELERAKEEASWAEEELRRVEEVASGRRKHAEEISRQVEQITQEMLSPLENRDRAKRRRIEWVGLGLGRGAKGQSGGESGGVGGKRSSSERREGQTARSLEREWVENRQGGYKDGAEAMVEGRRVEGGREGGQSEMNIMEGLVAVRGFVRRQVASLEKVHASNWKNGERIAQGGNFTKRPNGSMPAGSPSQNRQVLRDVAESNRAAEDRASGGGLTDAANRGMAASKASPARRDPPANQSFSTMRSKRFPSPFASAPEPVPNTKWSLILNPKPIPMSSPSQCPTGVPPNGVVGRPIMPSIPLATQRQILNPTLDPSPVLPAPTSHPSCLSEPNQNHPAPASSLRTLALGHQSRSVGPPQRANSVKERNVRGTAGSAPDVTTNGDGPGGETLMTIDVSEDDVGAVRPLLNNAPPTAKRMTAGEVRSKGFGAEEVEEEAEAGGFEQRRGISGPGGKPSKRPKGGECQGLEEPEAEGAERMRQGRLHETTLRDDRPPGRVEREDSRLAGQQDWEWGEGWEEEGDKDRNKERSTRPSAGPSLGTPWPPHGRHHGPTGTRVGRSLPSVGGGEGRSRRLKGSQRTGGRSTAELVYEFEDSDEEDRREGSGVADGMAHEGGVHRAGGEEAQGWEEGGYEEGRGGDHGMEEGREENGREVPAVGRDEEGAREGDQIRAEDTSEMPAVGREEEGEREERVEDRIREEDGGEDARGEPMVAWGEDGQGKDRGQEAAGRARQVTQRQARQSRAVPNGRRQQRQRRNSIPWTRLETDYVHDGVRRGKSWNELKRHGQGILLQCRTYVDIKDKWRNLERKGHSRHGHHCPGCMANR